MIYVPQDALAMRSEATVPKKELRQLAIESVESLRDRGFRWNPDAARAVACWDTHRGAAEAKPQRRWAWVEWKDGEIQIEEADACEAWRMATLKPYLEAACLECDLPDTAFAIDTNDGTHSGLSEIVEAQQALVFSFSRQDKAVSTLGLPDHTLLRAVDAPISNGNSLSDLIDRASDSSPWELKEDKAFWVGATTGGRFENEAWRTFPRSRLVLFARENPDLCDAWFSRKVGLSREVDGEMTALDIFGDEVVASEQLGYKYLVSVDGNCCAYQGLYWKLLSNCCVLKQESERNQWYYPLLSPWEHYVPVAEDLSDLSEKISWCREHDDEARRIAENGTRFALRYLSSESLHCYLRELLVAAVAG